MLVNSSQLIQAELAYWQCGDLEGLLGVGLLASNHRFDVF